MTRKVLAALATFALLVGTAAAGDKKHNNDSSSTYGSTYGTGSNPESTDVSGYTKKDGTYVEPHHRSKANETQYDNWGTKENENPYTGQKGTKTPDPYKP